MSDITDGFGNSWPRCELGKHCGMHVVRPGHAACWCENAKEEALLLMKENERMRNELARVNGQTMWICSCGGTDCAGQKKNAEQGLTIATIQDIVTNDKRSNKAKVLAIEYVLRKEAQP